LENLVEFLEKELSVAKEQMEVEVSKLKEKVD
jgi:hypothetical protein